MKLDHASQYSYSTSDFKETDWLTDYSPADRPWDTHRAQADDVGGIYARAFDFERLAARINACSGFLGFTWADDKLTGESRLKLKKAQFCRVRYCPVCQWRRSLMWQARFYQALPDLVRAYPKARWLFLTLTVRNCEVSELAATLKAMNEAWQRLVKREEFKPVQGWLRTTEVTRGKDRSAHPHFHVLLMVPPSWFTHAYIKQARWVELWQEALRANYLPSVDVRTVKAKGKATSTAELLQGAVAETLKYSTKPDDMIADPQWFLELTRQTYKKRFMASGGALKDMLREDHETNQDLITADGLAVEVESTETSSLLFSWQTKPRRYKKVN